MTLFSFKSKTSKTSTPDPVQLIIHHQLDSAWPLVTSLCVEQPGVLQKVQGMGWYLDEANIAQVSTNILDYELTPLHTVYEEICRDAEVRGQHTLSHTTPSYIQQVEISF